jgi:ATP-dependent DNA ligase
MTGTMLAWQTEPFTEPAVEDNGRAVTVRPVQAVEIGFDGVQRSSRYPSGAALRCAHACSAIATTRSRTGGASSVAERTASRRAHRSSSSAGESAFETPALAH